MRPLERAHPKRTNKRRWRALRWFVFDRDGWRCATCGRAARLELDHIAPLRARPDLEWAEGNLQPLCKRCHLLKTQRENLRPNLERERWRKWLNSGTLRVSEEKANGPYDPKANT